MPELPHPTLPKRAITADEIATFRRDGVFCARSLLDIATIDRMRDALEDVIANTSVLGNSALSRPDDGFYGDIFVWKLHDEFRDLALFSELPVLANQILESKTVNFFYEQFFVKRAGSPIETPWHNDIPFWPVDGTQIVSFWITLDPIRRDSSGLEFVRGSQQWDQRYKAVTPTRDAYMMDTDLPIAPDFSDLRDEYDVVGWDMEPGDVLVFGPMVVHGSSKNDSDALDRRALAFRYSGDDVVYAPRHATMPLLWEHGLNPGDRLCGSLFPQVLPRVRHAEIAQRWAAPEPPSPKAIAAFVEHLKQTGFSPSLES